MMKFNQYLPLTAFLPSLALISLHESAGSSGMAPRIARKKKSKRDTMSFHLGQLAKSFCLNAHLSSYLV